MSDSEIDKRAAELFAAQSNFLKGEILTIIDAVIVDERQLKATKDWIHATFKNRIQYVNDLCGCPSRTQMVNNKGEAVIV